jgi:drug/metabolite transporter (DMT)-like permease
MVAAAVTYTASVTLVKFLGEEYPASVQAVYHRGAGLVFLLPLILRNPLAAYRTSRFDIILWRAAATTISLTLALYAYQKLPFATANALSFTRALWMVPLALVLLRESVGPRRMLATVAGFAGVLLIVQPSARMQMGWPTAAALTAALLTALSISGTKIMSRDHSTTTLLAWTATLGFLFAIPPALFVWRWPSLLDLLLLSGIGIFATLTQACAIKGMRLGDAAAMAPIDYTRVVFALFVGFFLFRESPNAMALAGVAIVIAATLYLTWREARSASL